MLRMNFKNNYVHCQREKTIIIDPKKKVICKIIIHLISRYMSGRLIIMVMVKIYMKF